MFYNKNVLLSSVKRFIVDSIADTDKANYNAYVLVENFNDLARSKQDKSSLTSLPIIPFPIIDLDKPEMAETNQQAINQNFAALYESKVCISTPCAGPKYLIDNLLDPEKSDENSLKINEMYDQFFRDLKDK